MYKHLYISVKRMTCEPQVTHRKHCCQLSRIIWETPDFGLHLPVSRLESDVSRLITKVAISCRIDFPTIKFQIIAMFELL